jgi:hypothetical protein
LLFGGDVHVAGVSLEPSADGKLVHTMTKAESYSPMEAYAQSKLANIYFGQWLAEKEREAHPKVWITWVLPSHAPAHVGTC